MFGSFSLTRLCSQPNRLSAKFGSPKVRDQRFLGRSYLSSVWQLSQPVTLKETSSRSTLSQSISQHKTSKCSWENFVTMKEDDTQKFCWTTLTSIVAKMFWSWHRGTTKSSFSMRHTRVSSIQSRSLGHGQNKSLPERWSTKKTLTFGHWELWFEEQLKRRLRTWWLVKLRSVLS